MHVQCYLDLLRSKSSISGVCDLFFWHLEDNKTLKPMMKPGFGVGQNKHNKMGATKLVSETQFIR